MNRFSVTDLPLPGLKRITRQHLSDDRGFLSRIFCAEELSNAGWQKPVVQINHTYTARSGSIRGMHYQLPPSAEMKLVSCIRGAVWDVVVDLRADSPTFLHWYAENLSEDNGHAFLIPEGFAHGFQSLINDCELLYLHTEAYAQQAEAGIRYDDPQLMIKWPLSVIDISSRDLAYPTLSEEYMGIEL